jgi:uncharacterized protein YbjT (DUF2867 family)
MTTNYVDCSVMYTGGLVLLAIPARAQRGQVRLTSYKPEISWLCEDGVNEALRLPAGAPDHSRLVTAILGKGLVVAEFEALKEASGEPVRLWELGSGLTNPQSRHEMPRSAS